MLLLLSHFGHVQLYAIHRWQPTRLRRPWDSPGKNTGVDCHFLLQCMKVKSESEVAQSCPTRSDPMVAAYQAPPSMGFSRQEYWSGVPLPSLVQKSKFEFFSLGSNDHPEGHSFLMVNSLPYGEGSGTPLQYSCLENPMDGGAW